MISITGSKILNFRLSVAVTRRRYLHKSTNIPISSIDHDTLLNYTVIDVRSPSEYEADHVPGAINLPVLTDQQREEVGTLYSRNTRKAKCSGAALISANIADHIDKFFSVRDVSEKFLVYCWRGGQRSKSLSLVLKEIGFDVHLVDGGYKRFRAHVRTTLTELINSRRFVVLGGNTGSGKSLILECLRDSGEPVLHLEELARHKGSVLGNYFRQEQPSQKAFETNLWNCLRLSEPDERIWVESESDKIGKIVLPKTLQEQILTSPKVDMDVPLDSRVEFILRDYDYFVKEPAAIKPLLLRLEKVRGKKAVGSWLEMVDNKDFEPLVRSLISDHYDVTYNHSGKRSRMSPWKTVQLSSNQSLQSEVLKDSGVIDDLRTLRIECDKIMDCKVQSV